MKESQGKSYLKSLNFKTSYLLLVIIDENQLQICDYRVKIYKKAHIGLRFNSRLTILRTPDCENSISDFWASYKKIKCKFVFLKSKATKKPVVVQM